MQGGQVNTVCRNQVISTINCAYSTLYAENRCNILNILKRRSVMETIKEIVCGTLVVITFAAILYSVPI